MPGEQSYLVRGPDGRMSTVVARSVRGAVRSYMRSNRKLRKGDPLAVKLRGVGSWEHFKVTY